VKILLVVYDNESYIHWFPQGLAYIAAVLIREGYEVEIYNQDEFHYPEEHLTEYLDANHFDIVGVGVTGGYYQYRKLLKISEAINRVKKKLIPNIPICRIFFPPGEGARGNIAKPQSNPAIGPPRWPKLSTEFPYIVNMKLRKIIRTTIHISMHLVYSSWGLPSN